jgi:HTH-type transcriptional regulator, sugar sensing transcriptional regulator
LDLRGTVEELKNLGLTSYEAKCYVSLSRLGPSDARSVATDASIPNPSAYEALQRLASMGWIELVRKRPATYRARNPASVREMVSTRVNETFDALDELYNVAPAEEAELVYTLRGREKVLSKIYEMVTEAKVSIVLASPTMALVNGRILALLEQAIKRGVQVRVIGDEEAHKVIPSGAVLRTGSLVALDLLVDGNAALIALPDYSACGWLDSPQVATHFQQFLELMWNSSSNRS